MIITEIRFRKPQGNSFLLVKFVDKIRFNYSNSFPKEKIFVSRKTTHSLQAKRHSRARFQEKRLIRVLEPSRACICSTETRK